MNEDEYSVEPEQPDEQDTLLKRIEARLNQSLASRLSEYITGLKLEDPALMERLIEDQQRLRQKYSLPPLDLLLEEPSEYERQLKVAVQKAGVKMKATSDCGSFFTDNAARGVFMGEDNTIGVDIQRNDKDYTSSLKAFEHEYVHSLQHANSPRMPIELQEYEAYIANLNTKYLKEHPEDTINFIFGFFIASSVNTWYRLANERRGGEEPQLTPVWDDAEYFLKNVDQISDADIQGVIHQIRHNQDKVADDDQLVSS